MSNETPHNWTANVYIAENWAYMEAAGAVFLPAAGIRTGNNIHYIGDTDKCGYYWTSSTESSESTEAAALFFHGGEYWSSFEILEKFTLRYNGKAVRLVR